MEQENNFEEFEKIPTGKLYKEKAFWVATFLGGPIVAGYLFAQNFKALGQNDKVKNTWLITIISTIAIFTVAFFIADNVKIPKQLLPITYSAIAYGLFTKYQAENVKKHQSYNGEFYSWWRIIGVAIVGLLITLLIIFIGAIISDFLEAFY